MCKAILTLSGPVSSHLVERSLCWASRAAINSAVSLETSISWTRRLRVASCSVRPTTPPSGICVCLSQFRAFLAVFTSLIVASRSLSHRSASFGPSVDMATIVSECCEVC
jgi:hypothetical protein